jgi:hypothetical protein
MNANPAEGEYYLLEGLRPVKCEFVDWVEWSNATGGAGYEAAQAIVVDTKGKEYLLSTAFRGIGNSLYATTIFPDHDCARDMKTYRTLLDAKHGHQELLTKLIRSGMFRLKDEV